MQHANGVLPSVHDDRVLLPTQIIDHDLRYAGISSKTQRFAELVVDTLLKHYPGHPWTVEVNPTQGVLLIGHPMLFDYRPIQYVIRLGEVMFDAKMRKVIEAGGEILERFSQRRGRLDVGEAKAATPDLGDNPHLARMLARKKGR